MASTGLVAKTYVRLDSQSLDEKGNFRQIQKWPLLPCPKWELANNATEQEHKASELWR